VEPTARFGPGTARLGPETARILAGFDETIVSLRRDFDDELGRISSLRECGDASSDQIHTPAKFRV
jgi:hypothetical protein